jgi:hypothetical protein
VAELAVHPFLDLETTERSRWIAAFCDRTPVLPPGPMVAFPLLARGESPLSWLRDQFRRAQASGKGPDRLRDSVGDLVRRELDGIELTDRLQALGTLVGLAGACGFTEVGPKLRDWIRGDHYAAAVYRVGSHPVPLRQTVWSIVIAWGGSEGMVPFLKRDLVRPELESGALCFSALGRLSLFDAIAEIPSVFAWPAPYWKEILRRFFANFKGATRTLVEPHLLPAWQTCLGALESDPQASELFKPYWTPFRKLLLAAGLELSEQFGEDKFDLWPTERPWAGLQIDFHPQIVKLDERLFAYYQGLYEGADTPLSGGESLGYDG